MAFRDYFSRLQQAQPSHWHGAAQPQTGAQRQPRSAFALHAQSPVHLLQAQAGVDFLDIGFHLLLEHRQCSLTPADATPGSALHSESDGRP